MTTQLNPSYLHLQLLLLFLIAAILAVTWFFSNDKKANQKYTLRRKILASYNGVHFEPEDVALFKLTLKNTLQNTRIPSNNTIEIKKQSKKHVRIQNT